MEAVVGRLPSPPGRCGARAASLAAWLAYPAAPAAIYAGLRWALPGPNGEPFLGLVLLAPPVLALVAPFAAAGPGRAAGRGFAQGGAATALFAATVAGLGWAADEVAPGSALGLGVLLAAFGSLLLALQFLARNLGAPTSAGQALALVVGLLLATTYAWIDPLIEVTRDRPVARAALARLAVDGNPALAGAAAFLATDLLKHRAVYGSVSELGAYYAYSYSPWTQVLAAYLAAATAATALGMASGRLRRPPPGGAAAPPERNVG